MKDARNERKTQWRKEGGLASQGEEPYPEALLPYRDVGRVFDCSQGVTCAMGHLCPSGLHDFFTCSTSSSSTIATLQDGIDDAAIDSADSIVLTHHGMLINAAHNDVHTCTASLSSLTQAMGDPAGSGSVTGSIIDMGSSTGADNIDETDMCISINEEYGDRLHDDCFFFDLFMELQESGSDVHEVDQYVDNVADIIDGTDTELESCDAVVLDDDHVEVAVHHSWSHVDSSAECLDFAELFERYLVINGPEEECYAEDEARYELYSLPDVRNVPIINGLDDGDLDCWRTMQRPDFEDAGECAVAEEENSDDEIRRGPVVSLMQALLSVSLEEGEAPAGYNYVAAISEEDVVEVGSNVLQLLLMQRSQDDDDAMMLLQELPRLFHTTFHVPPAHYLPAYTFRVVLYQLKDMLHVCRRSNGQICIAINKFGEDYIAERYTDRQININGNIVDNMQLDDYISDRRTPLIRQSDQAIDIEVSSQRHAGEPFDRSYNEYSRARPKLNATLLADAINAGLSAAVPGVLHLHIEKQKSSRQIYITFPSESEFTEDDAAEYFRYI
ncbi:hypothetical protein GOP47_0015908 [Adiantum capillus-veneris]|uniref:Uncharacterized protein n=1 Tax=Adiantum capillus-veneris TaxID=13818 RepID=A0A9D4ZD17_ADICA|nr:hypothetical protein GOP47_0015908 [Adiantum capillus-veneris]